jgi:hypothetical protein
MNPESYIGAAMAAKERICCHKLLTTLGGINYRFSRALY